MTGARPALRPHALRVALWVAVAVFSHWVLDALVHPPSIEPLPHSYRPEGYLQGGEVPKDPWSGRYQYESPGTHNTYSFDLWTLGADGAPGGDGTNSDIGNWSDEKPSS